MADFVDTAPIEAYAQADPATWGVTATEAAHLLARQMCPVCGEGPWKSPLIHVHQKHGIRGPIMRDICGLTLTETITDESLHEALSAKALTRRGRLIASNRARRGSKHAPVRVTRAKKIAIQQLQLRSDIVEKRRAFHADRRIETCTIDGCERPHQGHGLCAGHLSRLKTKGQVGDAAMMSTADSIRLAAKISGRSRRVLTAAQVREVLNLHDQGWSQQLIAERFSVSQSSVISKVIRGMYRPADEPQD